MFCLYGSSSSNKTKIPFKDLHGVLDDQFQVASDLFTLIYLCLKTLSYSKAMFWYSDVIYLARIGCVTISYSKNILEILYLASGLTFWPAAVFCGLVNITLP